MAPRDSFLLRVDPQIMAAMRAWAADDLRSVNGQIEFILRKSLADAGRLKNTGKSGESDITRTKRRKRS